MSTNGQHSDGACIIIPIPLAIPIQRLYLSFAVFAQNSANDASMKVAPKLSLNATLSSIADRRSMPFTYLCILDVGTMLYPLEAMNYFSVSMISVAFPDRDCYTCTPKTNIPNSSANVFENELTATPPSNPIVHQTVSSPCLIIKFPPSESGRSNAPSILPALSCL